MRLMLDTDVLVKLCHPTGYQDVKEWFGALLARGDDAPEVLISVLAFYEFRRRLTAIEDTQGLGQLDELGRALRIVPVTAEVAAKAAEMSRGMPRRGRLSDADMMMAVQADLEGAILVTGDQTLHQMAGVNAKDWNEIIPD